MNKRHRGFTLIELLIVMAIIGIIAAIAIPNLLNALDRGKQKRSMADMRSVGTAIESYAVENGWYPSSASYAALSTLLKPDYLKTPPAHDGWGNAFIYQPGAVTGAGYTLKCTGKDGAADGSYAGGPTTTFVSDIVFVDGQFLQWPEGTQR